MRLVTGGVALVAAVATVWAAGTASGQSEEPGALGIYIGDRPASSCEGGTNDGERCNNDDDCPGVGATCSGLFVCEFVPTLDNPDVYDVSHKFFDSGNKTTMFAFFNKDGLNFATGRAQKTQSLQAPSSEDDPVSVQALFEWINGPLNDLDQGNSNNKLKQKSYTAIRIVFSAKVLERLEPPPPINATIPLYAWGDCPDDVECDSPSEVIFPTETENCTTKVRVTQNRSVKNITKTSPDGGLEDVKQTAKWKLDCSKIGLPAFRDICLDGSHLAESDLSECPAEERVSAQDLLKAFEGRKDTVHAKGKEKNVPYCDNLVGENSGCPD